MIPCDHIRGLMYLLDANTNTFRINWNNVKFKIRGTDGVH